MLERRGNRNIDVELAVEVDLGGNFGEHGTVHGHVRGVQVFDAEFAGVLDIGDNLAVGVRATNHQVAVENLDVSLTCMVEKH